MDQPTVLNQARHTLGAHVAAKGAAIFEKYGPRIGWRELAAILADRDFVRYPCVIAFDSGSLRSGEFAHPVAKGARPEEGFTVHVHPAYQSNLDHVPLLVLYQLVLVNYGEFASSADAETFGATALGLTREEYYQQLCDLADQVAPSKKGQ